MKQAWRADWREKAGWLLAVALLAVLVFGYLMPATAYFTAVPGTLGVPRHNAVVLEHLYRVVTGSGGLWDPAFYYPFASTLAFSDNHLGSAPTYVLGRLLGLSREHAFDAWFVAGTLLNFASALYVLRRLGASTAGAALGACFFTFALPAAMQDNHAQLVHRFAIPLAALALWQMFERRRLADLGRVAFFTAWQFYCSIYLGLFLVYLLAALACSIVLVRRPLEWPRWSANLAAEPVASRLGASGLVLLSIVALAYLGGHYLAAAHAYGLEHWRPIEVLGRMLPRPGSYLIADASPQLAWLGRGVSVPDRWEHQMFIGFGASALILAACLAAWRGHVAQPALARVVLIALALLLVGTLWVDHLSLYYLVAWLPGIKEIRAVTRIILVMLLPMSVLVALGADLLWRRASPAAAAGVAALLAALVVAEPLTVIRYNVPIAHWQARIEAAKQRLPAALPGDAILLVRTSAVDANAQVHAELDGMLLGQDIGHPVLNGYSAFFPPGYRLRPCALPSGRLMGYSSFRGGIDVSDYARRLVVVDLDSSCATLH